MIRYGDDLIIPELKKLWKTCFEDEDAYIDNFFAALYKKQDVLLAEENGVLMGASFFLPGKLLEGAGPDRWQKIRYVYALAVYPQYRGRGIAGKLLRHAYSTYHAPLIAEPADEGLAGGFYKPLGFEKAFYLEKEQVWMPHSYNIRAAEIHAQETEVDAQAAEIHADEETGAPGGTDIAEGTDAAKVTGQGIQPHRMQLYAADAFSYARIRDAYFAEPGYIKWPMEHIAFALEEHRANGGDALICECGKKQDLLLYYIEDEKAVVTETTLPAAGAAQLLGSYISQDRMPRTVIIWKPFSDKNTVQGAEGMYRLTGMIYGKMHVRGYLNLSLD